MKMPRFHVDLSDEEVKACLSDMGDVHEWTENAIKNKARKVTDRLLADFFGGRAELEIPFTPEEEQAIANATGGRRFFDFDVVKKLPLDIKRMIIRKMRISTPEQRREEAERDRPQGDG